MRHDAVGTASADEQLAAFVAASWPSLLRTAYLLTGSRSSADDLVQASLVKCLGAWRRGGPPAHAEAYVRTAMVRQAVRWRRRRVSSELAFAVPPELPVPDPTDALVEEQAVRAALRALPIDQRAVLVLRFWHQCSESEIAEAMRISPGTVKSRTSRGLAALRRAGLLADPLGPADNDDVEARRG